MLSLLLGLALAGPPAIPAEDVVVTDLPDDLPPGLSGLTRLPDGRLLAISERGDRAVLLEGDARGVTVQAVVPVTGRPRGTDLEAVAVLPDDRLVLGTESRDSRDRDRLLYARVEEGGLVVEGGADLSYLPFGLTPKQNTGLEGVCAIPGLLVAVSETAGGSGRHRWAPAWLQPLAGGPGHTARLRLTSSSGLVSALACVGTPGGGVVLTAVERHFGTLRLVRWVVPADGGDVDPVGAWDLGPAVASLTANPEGIVVDPDGTVHLVTDNDFGGVLGPGRLIRVQGLPPPVPPAPPPAPSPGPPGSPPPPG